jgi:hypothetical protein
MALVAARRAAIDVVIAMEAHAAFLRARPAAVDIGLGPVPRAVGARRIARLRRGIARAASAVGPGDATHAGRAFRRAPAAAILPRLRPVLHPVRARGRGAEEKSVCIHAHPARAIGGLEARAPRRAGGRAHRTAINARLTAVLHPVGARGREALTGRAAQTARAIAAGAARLARRAGRRARSTAINAALKTILHAVRAGGMTRGRRGVTRPALAIHVGRARLPRAAFQWARAAAVDIGLRAIFHRVRARGRRARTGRAHPAHAVAPD